MRLRSTILPIVGGGLLLGCAYDGAPPRATSFPAAAGAVQSAQTAEVPGRKIVLENLADKLESLYVFPDWGERYAAHLRQRTLTADELAMTPQDFASMVTRELAAIHADAHLRLEVEEAGGPGEMRGPPIPSKSLVRASDVVDDVVYLRFDTLWGDPETMAALASLVERNEPPRALIVDLRNNRGGGLQEIEFLSRHLFGAPQQLVVMEIRRSIYDMEGGPFGESDTLKRIDSPEKVVRLSHEIVPVSDPALVETKLLILTSDETASAAEHFALAFKRTERATLIGKATKGAAHFGGLMPVGEGFRAFIPAGRTFDPDTGESWESVGVTPDVIVDPDQALGTALRSIGLDEETIAEFEKQLAD